MVRVIGFDPGFKSFGYAVVELRPERDRAVAAGVIRTEKSSKKHNVLSTDDNFRRARAIADQIGLLLETWQPVAMCAESMSYPPSSSAAAKMAMSWGILATYSSLRGLALVQASPQEVKKTVWGSKNASKEEVAAAVRSKYPEFAELLSSLRVPVSLHEHAYDAGAAIITGLRGEILETIRRTLGVEVKTGSVADLRVKPDP